MKRMFGGMSKAESMPNLTALVPDDLDDPFDYDDGLDLGLGAFGQSPPVPLATDLMDLDKEVRKSCSFSRCLYFLHTRTHSPLLNTPVPSRPRSDGWGWLGFCSVEPGAAGREPGGLLWHDGGT